jgi:hypothetical protein
MILHLPAVMARTVRLAFMCAQTLYRLHGCIKPNPPPPPVTLFITHPFPGVIQQNASTWQASGGLEPHLIPQPADLIFAERRGRADQHFQDIGSKPVAWHKTDLPGERCIRASPPWVPAEHLEGLVGHESIAAFPGRDRLGSGLLRRLDHMGRVDAVLVNIISPGHLDFPRFHCLLLSEVLHLG